MDEFLISTADVKPGAMLLLDARFRLTDPAAGRALYLAEHLPGALHLDLAQLSGPMNGKNGRHPLPSRADLKGLFSSLGVGPGVEVVVYDDADHAGAARAWMLLRWMGFATVRVLDGGLRAWKDAALPLEKGEVAPSAKVFVEGPPLVSFFGREELAGRRLVDARAPERYRGEVEPLDPKAGHIPGAENLFYQTLLGPDGKFRSRGELERLLPKEESVFYCGSGVTAAVLLLASALVGRSASVYPGSWSEWCAWPDAPVETGSYRPGVVAVVSRGQEVLLFERSDYAGSWQFAQGGVEEGETEEEALARELAEEVGGFGVKVLRRGNFPTLYEWPRPDGRNGHKGQRHRWFLCELEGFDLARGDGSFRAFRWVKPAEVEGLVVGFKRESYREGLRSVGL